MGMKRRSKKIVEGKDEIYFHRKIRSEHKNKIDRQSVFGGNVKRNFLFYLSTHLRFFPQILAQKPNTHTCSL